MPSVFSDQAPTAETNGRANGPVPPHGPRLARLADLLDQAERDAIAAHAAYTTATPQGPITGLAALDRELGGHLVPGLHVLHASPGIGKTALALQAAADCGAPALFVSCEMAALELLRRHAARVCGTYLGRLKSGELPPDQVLGKLRRAAAAAPDLVLGDATDAYASPEWIRTAARVVRGERDGLLIVVDSIHAWADSAPGDSTEYERLGAAVAALRTLAGQLDCPILGIAERNRGSMKQGGQSASAGSRKFEYGGTSVLELGTEADAQPDAAGELVVTLKLTKNRNGRQGHQIALKFHGALQRFREA